MNTREQKILCIVGGMEIGLGSALVGFGSYLSGGFFLASGFLVVCVGLISKANASNAEGVE